MDVSLYLKLALSVALYLVVFGIWGAAANRFLKRETDIVEEIMIGFFLYFCFFQVIAIPLIILQYAFRMLVFIWIAVTAVVTGIALLIISGPGGRRRPAERGRHRKRWKASEVLLVIAAAVVAVSAFVLVLRQEYYGWDTGYYIGLMNEAVSTDTMYVIDGNSGIYQTELNFRYCLSSFYLQFTIPARLMNIRPLFAAFYIIRPLGFILALLTAVLIGRVVLGESRSSLAVFVILYFLINILWLTSYTSSEFWLKRLYEAKGYCSNIILPMAFYIFLDMYRKPSERDALWGELFIVAFSSVAISMSSLITLPALIGIGGLVVFILFKDRIYTLANMLICMAPNIIYAVIFYLNTIHIVQVPVK